MSEKLETLAVASRTLTGPTFFSIDIKFERFENYAKDVVFVSMRNNYGNGDALTMQLNLFKLRKMIVGLRYCAQHRKEGYSEHTSKDGVESHLFLKVDRSDVWLNIHKTCNAKTEKIGKKFERFELNALISMLETMCDYADHAFYRLSALLS